MKNDMLLNEIIQLRDRLTNLKFQLFEENNSDMQRHLSYSMIETEVSLKEKMNLLENNH
ncbi:MAG: hypothetical protein JEZ08_07365 [Clostridiales bacterium]|nr:hypothetical protein [Clostridiales bacterium]